MPRSHRRQRDLSAVSHHVQFAERAQIVAVLLGETHCDVVLILAIPKLRRFRAVDRTPDREPDVTRVEPVEGGLLPIDVHHELGSRVRHIALQSVELGKHQRAFEQRHGLFTQPLQHIRVVSGDLDRDREARGRTGLHELDGYLGAGDRSLQVAAQTLQHLGRVVRPVLEIHKVDGDCSQMGSTPTAKPT